MHLAFIFRISGVYYIMKHFHDTSTGMESQTKMSIRKKSALVINLEYALFISVVFFTRLLPLHAAYRMTNFFAWLTLHFNPRHGPRSIRLIMHSGIRTDRKSAAELSLKSFQHFGKVFVESVKFDQIVNEVNFSQYITCSDDPLTRRMMDPETEYQMIVTTAHFGNWELAGSLHSKITGRPMTSIMRPFDNPKIGEYMYRCRHRYQHVSYSKQLGLKPLLRAHAEGHNITIVSDQHAANGEGIPVMFFGHPASTQKTPALLHLKLGTPIGMPYLIREDDDFHFKFYCAELPPFTPSGNKDEDVRTIVQLYTRMIEEQIRRFPEQWLWSHRRWLDCEREPYPPESDGQPQA